MVTETLSGLEEAYNTPEAFRAFCQKFREQHPDGLGAPIVQWYLEPADCRLKIESCRLEGGFDKVQSDWTWHDPFEDCNYEVVENGLKIHAANGRDLWYLNLSAPRLLRPVSGDFTVQTVVTSPQSTLTPGPSPVKGEGSKSPSPLVGESWGEGEEPLPAIGGLLLWKDKRNYLRLDRGTRGIHEINFCGCINDDDIIIGRGRLVSERAYLRLERIGNRVNALCSTDGEEWFTAGRVEFVVDDPVEVGLHAIGMIDRTIYHGAYPDGTATVFKNFNLWTR